MVSSKIEYVLQPADKENFPSSMHITRLLVFAAVRSVHPTLPHTDSKIFASIQRKFNETIDTGADLPLDPTETGWVLDRLEKSELDPNLSMWKWELIDSLKETMASDMRH